MKIIYLGTPEFAVEPLKSLLNSKHQVVAVVTQPDRPVGRKAVLTPCAVKSFALSQGLKVLNYNKIRFEGIEELKSLNADIMITCAYGQILSQEILDVTKFGVINIHGSLLPAYRGASPIQQVLVNGEKFTGITIMQTDVGIDTGDIICAQKLEIESDDNALTLSNKLSCLGANMIVDAVNSIENGTAVKTKQDHNLATNTKIIKKQDGLIDFNKSSQEIVNLIKGLYVWPVAYTYLNGKTLKVFNAQEVKCGGKAGEVISADAKVGFIIGTADGGVKLNEIQLEGGKRMSAHDFLLGKKIEKGSFIG